ncbi:MAG: ABC transporter permease [Clostridiales bacterium]|jgi:ABC-2 type transport system permease protein|nr:ABC transporter permease [Clostridiales bacterium]
MSTVTTDKKKSRPAKELNAMLTIIAREVTLLIKNPMMFVIGLVMPFVFMWMLGGNLSQNMAEGLGYDYNQFMFVGMMVSMLFFGTTMSVASLVQDRNNDFTQEMMVSPVSRYSIVAGKIVGSSVTAILQLISTVVVGLIMQIQMTVTQVLLMFALAPLFCFVAGATMIPILAFIKSEKTANLVVSIFGMVPMMISGAIIPIGNTGGALLVLNRIMPMTYCLDLARAVWYAGTEQFSSVVMFNPALVAAILVPATALFLIVGTFLFARAEQNK